ncbi:hypothetical protein [Zavarzinia sp.]|uniref:hypothetical protein n=1 Tax=Zavarzinia sp. TaxID=2027920 RepID=UPI003566650A
MARMKWMALVAVAGALGACASPRADAALQAQTSLIGMSKADLLSCAGAPAASVASVPNEEVLTYESRTLSGYAAGPSVGLGFFGGSGNIGYGFGMPIGPTPYVDDSQNCRASFTIRNGKVARVVYGGTDVRQTQRLEQCYQIIENCLPRPANP